MDVSACYVGSVVTCVKQNPQGIICNSPEPNKIHVQKTLSKQSMKSPPLVTLSIPSTSTSHANCNL